MDDPRIPELLSDILLEMRGMRQELTSLNSKVNHLNGGVETLNSRVERLEDQQVKTNLAIGELRLSVMTLAEKMDEQREMKQRIHKLEDAVFHNRP